MQVTAIKFIHGMQASLQTGTETGETYFREGEVVEGVVIRPADPEYKFVDLQLDDGSVAVGVPKENVEEVSLDLANVGRWDLGG